VGFNNIRFDDEFIRRICYRNFVDPYEWHWKENRSRWDLLDAIRMMRALRPEGLRWPLLDGKPTVKLELLAKENELLHDQAHDALSDVRALLQIAQRFTTHQPRLFSYLLSMRDKKAVAAFVEKNDIFLYTSGKYPSEYEKTTVVTALFTHPRREAAIVYNLRCDPTPWLKKNEDELLQHWQARYSDSIEPLPLKTVQYNRCPALAPLSVLDKDTAQRLSVDMPMIKRHRQILQDTPSFIAVLKKVLDRMEHAQQTAFPLDDQVDNQIYDGFWNDADRRDLATVRQHDPAHLAELVPKLHNKRLRELLPLYKARNYPELLTHEEQTQWELHRQHVLLQGGENSPVARFYSRLNELTQTAVSKRTSYLLTELQLYAESIMPSTIDE
jgi:exodeoxyribonuclease-1